MTQTEPYKPLIREGGLTTSLGLDLCDRGREKAVCVPYSMRCATGVRVLSAVCDGDPKGGGGITTRARYSRKRHTYTPSFHPLSLTTPLSDISPIMRDFQSYEGFTLRKPLWRSTFDVPFGDDLFCDLDYWIMDYGFLDLYPDTPGAIGTRSSDIGT